MEIEDEVGGPGEGAVEKFGGGVVGVGEDDFCDADGGHGGVGGRRGTCSVPMLACRRARCVGLRGKVSH